MKRRTKRQLIRAATPLIAMALAAGGYNHWATTQSSADPTTTTTIVTGESPPMPTEHVRGPFPITRVVDGDTVWVDDSGERVKVRLIGLDTPETVHPNKGVECFGVEASNRAKELLTGQSVFLESDPAADSIDRYGRTLAYIWITSGTLFNLEMIAGGYGFEYTYDLPYRYQAHFKAAEADARNNNRGLWAPAACDAAAATNR